MNAPPVNGTRHSMKTPENRSADGSLARKPVKARRRVLPASDAVLAGPQAHMRIWPPAPVPEALQ